jgi:aryl-alcohol dehydrogenase-like predicted oxidoreductase
LEYRNIGHSGLPVSAVGLGCNNFGQRCDAEQTAAVVHKALELGVTLFDTADIYGPAGVSEEYLGRALEGHREEVVIATKFVGPMGGGPLMRGASRRYVLQAVEASLRRLGTDHIDLYQVHFPDTRTPIEETMRALDDLVRQGKVRYIGCSNFAGWQVVEAQWIARSEHLTPFVSAQNEYNLLNRSIEAELVPACSKYGLGVLPYFPLASGFLTGKYRPGEPPPAGTRLALVRTLADKVLTEEHNDRLRDLESFAQGKGRTMLELAVGWLASQSHVASVIAGATRPEQIEENVAAAEWRLTAEELKEIDGIMGTGAGAADR